MAGVTTYFMTTGAHKERQSKRQMRRATSRAESEKATRDRQQKTRESSGVRDQRRQRATGVGRNKTMGDPLGGGQKADVIRKTLLGQ